MAHNYCLSLCLPTVPALILDIIPEPNNPIEDSGESCLSAGEKAEIICRNYGFPVPTVEFTKDGAPVIPDDRYSRSSCAHTCTE